MTDLNKTVRVPAIQVRDCSFGYDGRPVLSGVNLSIHRGEVVVVTGPNGAGKTTLLNLVTGVLRPDAGTVEIDGRSASALAPRELAGRIAVVPQDSVFHFPYTVGDVVRMGRTPYLGFWGFESPDDLAAAREAMALCDIEPLAGRMVSQLSGGERQRAVIARALAQQPRILALDEPTRSLDLRHVRDILQTLKRVRTERQLTVLIITHDLNFAARIADRVVILREGRIHRDGKPQEVLVPGTIREAFDVESEVISGKDGRPVVLPWLEEDE